MRTLAILGLVLVCAAPPAAAGPILESAERLAAEVQPRWSPPCLASTLAGRDAAEQREGSTAYFVGGILLPVVMPMLARATRPSPPAALEEGRSPADAACFRDGYRQRGQEKKADSGWAGSGFGLAIWGTIIVAITAGDPADIEFPF
ncbi:MAG: hypothetical protein OXH75_26030 [Acidobacteria bacterium]|nr:hypothetical protein [Acidobacteriota bacterium]